MSISPLSFTDHSQRAPLAVLSMHMPTAVLPSVACAALHKNPPITTITAIKTDLMASLLCPDKKSILKLVPTGDRSDERPLKPLACDQNVP
jgi:hypothetical protein